MKRLFVSLLMLVALAVTVQAQASHIAGQLVGEGTKGLSDSNPLVGASLSGAVKIDHLVITGEVTGLRAHKNFLNNGTQIDLEVGARVYPMKFLYGEFGYHQDGQYNQSFVQVGHSYYAGGGLNFGDAFIVGANYISNDGTVNQTTAGRIYGDAYVPLSKHLSFKGSLQYKLLKSEQPFTFKSFTGHDVRVGAGFAFVF